MQLRLLHEQKKVRLLGMKQLGEIGPDGKPMASQFLPAWYNVSTELTMLVEPEANVVPFELSTAKRKP